MALESKKHNITLKNKKIKFRRYYLAFPFFKTIVVTEEINLLTNVEKILSKSNSENFLFLH